MRRSRATRTTAARNAPSSERPPRKPTADPSPTWRESVANAQTASGLSSAPGANTTIDTGGAHQRKGRAASSPCILDPSMQSGDSSPEGPPSSARGETARLLVVDDEPESLRATVRLLSHLGYDVTALDTGKAAADAVVRGTFDALISDISMPGIDGIELLQIARRHDGDLPVVLMTGAPAIATAVMALDHGAFKYLMKPIAPERLEEVVRGAVRMRRMAEIRREALKVGGAAPTLELAESFSRALKSLWVAYQPIVQRGGTLYGYEALLRSTEPKLPNPGAVLDAAERLNRLNELGRQMRTRAAEPILGCDPATLLFVNLHPRDLEDDELVSPDSALAKIAKRVVLEITERSSVDSVQDLRRKVARLRETGYRIAIDDLGAGYAGLTSFALLEPDIVKIDLSLIRDVDTTPVKQRLIASITSLCREMGILVVCEGVETLAERDSLVDLGCELFQGFFHAKPGRAFPEFRW
ncbi:MAG: EAL domain-containing response regulator [Myxococcales bacterium]|nr:EAL domain-containing response regulator [Myxococcales bacterium]